uniref:Uncharacterized protein n=1 Tax=Moniliophthora roreri TaxID=221103 RepID=A0A0W0G1U0_MONRR
MSDNSGNDKDTKRGIIQMSWSLATRVSNHIHAVRYL